MRSLIATVGIALFLSLGGCGTSAEDKRKDTEAAEARASAKAEASASAEAAAEREARLARARDLQTECRQQMGRLLRALEQINGRLDVGLTNAALGDRLGDVAVAYNDVPFKKLGPECVTHVGIPLENAYNQYTKSQGKWDDCLEDYSCSVEGEKLTELQSHWTKASKQIARADRSLSSAQRFMASD